jgi:hypothetical protein
MNFDECELGRHSHHSPLLNLTYVGQESLVVSLRQAFCCRISAVVSLKMHLGRALSGTGTTLLVIALYDYSSMIPLFTS